MASFVSDSEVSDLHGALGQYLLYEELLATSRPDTVLYLGIPKSIFDTLFKELIGEVVRRKFNLRTAVFDPELERIVQWNK